MSEHFEAAFARASRGVVPASTIVVLLLLSVIPLGLPHISHVGPALSLATVYYWTTCRPDLLPLATVFGLGVLQDLILGTPLGLSALVLLLASGFVVSQRRAILGKGFVVSWLGFVLVALGAAVIGWLAASLYFLTIVGFTPIILEAAITAALYPLFAWCLGQVHRRLVG